MGGVGSMVGNKLL